MLPKPKACEGCVLWGDGQGWVPDRIPEGATVLFQEQNPGVNEEEGRRIVAYEGGHEVTEPCTPQPLIGPTGYIWSKTFLPLAGLDPAEVGVANVLRCRWQMGYSKKTEVRETHLDESGNIVPEQTVEIVTPGERTNSLPPREVYQQAEQHCTKAHYRLPESVKLIVAQGAPAWRFVGGPQPLDLWRGHTLPPEYGSALAFGTTWAPFADRPKVLATVHIADLKHRPKLDLVTRKDFVKIRSVLDGTWPKPMPPRIDANTCSYEVMVAWFNEAARAPYMVIDTEYDLDTKTLGLIGLSIPGDYPTPVIQYHWFEGTIQSGRRTDFLYWLRETIRSVPSVFQNALADIPVLRQACNIDWPDYKRVEDTMQAHAVLWCELPHSFEFMASVDGQYPKVKHLYGIDTDLYNEGDLLDTGSLWEARLKEFERDPVSRKVYDQQMRLLPHLDRSMQEGIAVDQEKVPPAILKYQERVKEGEAMLHAYCGWPMNPRSDDQLKVWLYEVEGMPVHKHPETKEVTTNADAISAMRNRYFPFDAREDEMNMSEGYIKARIEQGAHPLLEAYILYARADHVLSHYLLPLVKNNAV